MNNPHSYHPSKSRISKDQLVMGIHAVKEILTYSSDRLLRLYTEPLKDKGRKSEVIDLCIKKNIPIAYVSFETLTNMAGSDSHQSFVAHVKGREYLALKDFLKTVEEKPKSLVLMLDQILDPQNLGALLRCAECFNVDAVVFSKNRGSEITPVTTKTSCGASEILPLVRVSNLAEAVSQFQQAGFDAVATLLDASSQSLFEFRFNDKTLLIVGSEGEGIQMLIRKKADRSIYIPMQGRIESLNVAQATSVLLYAAQAQQDRRS